MHAVLNLDISKHMPVYYMERVYRTLVKAPSTGSDVQEYRCTCIRTFYACIAFYPPPPGLNFALQNTGSRSNFK